MNILKTFKWFFVDQFTFGFGGGGGGSPAPATTTVNNGTLPAYLQPYVENMLNATQSQVYNSDMSAFNPYQPYSNNASDYVAGASPMMEQSYSTAANLQTPDQYGTASDMSTISGLGALDTTDQAGMYGNMGAQAGMSYGQNAQNPYAVASYMNPYIQNTLAPALQLQNQQFGQQQVANQAQATQQGAFGGGRSAVMQGLNQQNQDLAQNQLVGNAYNQAYNTANQNMQNAASLGMQGAQTGLAGIGAQQAGYANAGQQATNLATIGGQQLGATENIAQLQNTLGAQQQNQQQNIINQAVQNYATAQQYPYMQLGMLSNMIHGLPMQSSTTQSYQATPNMLQQTAGAGLGALGAYKVFGS